MGFRVGGMVNKQALNALCCLLLMVTNVSYAGINPFKKSKDYMFGHDVVWYEDHRVAIKSGAVQDASDTHYYHLIIDNDQLLLRLGKNDPSGELENTRKLENLSIVEVNVDGRPLPLFNWCLQNQQDPGKKLKQNAIVANAVCINAGGGGDFIINLDRNTVDLLYRSKMLEFVVAPYGRRVKLSYSMLGYPQIMDSINKPAPVVKKPAPQPVVIAAPKPMPKSKPKKATPKPKPVKICYARPPADYKSKVPTATYPCNDMAKKASAEAKVTALVKQEKQKKAAALAVEKQKKAKKLAEQQQVKAQSNQDSKRETEWDSKQASLWISRCKVHWSKNKSPCYCQKYLAQAPKGIKNTCNQ